MAPETCPDQSGEVALARRAKETMKDLNLLVRLRPVAFIAILLAIWQIAVMRHPGQLLPSPWQVVGGLADLLQHGLLFKYVVASLFRVTWGFGLAVILAIPLGLIIGWYHRAD